MVRAFKLLLTVLSALAVSYSCAVAHADEPAEPQDPAPASDAPQPSGPSAAADPPAASADTAPPAADEPAPAAARCTPGRQVTCPCAGGAQGVQVCAPDGASFEACSCSAKPSAKEPAAEEPSDKSGYRPRHYLWGPGAGLLLVGYISGLAVTGALADDDNLGHPGEFLGYSLIPIAGPFIMLGVEQSKASQLGRAYEPYIREYAGIYVATGVAQIAGAALLTLGLAWPEESGGDADGSGDGAGNAARAMVLPVVSPGYAGLAASGTF